jgi:formylmethanofuran dehydrogenase subunit E
MRLSFDELLAECEVIHGHMCPGQLLGVRMALLGCRLIDIQDPRDVDRKKLIVWVEIDRCMTDAISAVTGVRLGRRSLKFLDYGKVAATFLNIDTGNAVRIVALGESRSLADTRYPEVALKKERQLRTYREASDSDLFKIERVAVSIGEMDLPGRPRARVICGHCHEEVNDGREVTGIDEVPTCRPCAQGSYYERRASDNVQCFPFSL